MRLTNQDGSFPILSELDLEQVKSAMGKVDWDRASAVIPKGMTADNYQDMNILPGNRIGWEQKQEHLHRLSDLYTLGYLTEEEHEKRVEWVNSAQTIEQVNIAFMDLRRNILSAEAGSYLKPASAVKDAWVLMNIILIFIILASLILTSLHLWAAELIMISGVIVIAEAPRLHRRRK